MKIAVTSDLHGMKPAPIAREVISQCDLLILCGDIFEASYNNSKLEKYFSELSKSGTRIVMTPGNHDWGIFYAEHPDAGDSWYRPRGSAKEYSKKYLKEELGIDCLIDEEITIDGLRIYGTPWTPMFCNWAFMMEDNEEIQEKFKNIPNDLDILICHGPFKDPDLELDTCHPKLYPSQPDHLGSRMLAMEILKKSPKRFFCGHIHSGSHDEVRFGDTICRNVSYLGESYSPEYPIYTFEV